MFLFLLYITQKCYGMIVSVLCGCQTCPPKARENKY